MHFGTRGDDTLLEARWKIVHGTYEFSETLQESSVSGPVGVTTAGASPSCCCLSSGTSSASTSGNRATDAATRRCFMQFSSRGSSSGCHGAHRARLGRWVKRGSQTATYLMWPTLAFSASAYFMSSKALRLKLYLLPSFERPVTAAFPCVGRWKTAGNRPGTMCSRAGVCRRVGLALSISTRFEPCLPSASLVFVANAPESSPDWARREGFEEDLARYQWLRQETAG